MWEFSIWELSSVLEMRYSDKVDLGGKSSANDIYLYHKAGRWKNETIE